MRLRWNARAETETSILWIGAILAVFIMLAWYGKKIYPLSKEISIVSEDLSAIKSNINKACSSTYYQNKVNPKTDKGFLSVKDFSVCINTTKTFRCKDVFCNTSVDIRLDLAELTNLVIQRNSSFTFYGN